MIGENVPTCPIRVDRTPMRQRWGRLTFLHWSYDPAVVQAFLALPLG